MRTERFIVSRRIEGVTFSTKDRFFGRHFTTHNQSVIPLILDLSPAARGFRAADDVHILAVTYRLSLGGDAARIELLIHREHVAAGGRGPCVADGVLRLAGEGVHAGNLAVAHGSERGFRRIRQCGSAVVAVIPAVLVRNLTALGLRGRDGRDVLVRSAVADRRRAADRPRVERRTHIHRHVFRCRNRTLAHGGRHRHVIDGGVGERRNHQRLKLADHRLVVVLRPRVGERVVGERLRRQVDGRTVADDRVTQDGVDLHLRVQDDKRPLTVTHREAGASGVRCRTGETVLTVGIGVVF